VKCASGVSARAVVPSGLITVIRVTVMWPTESTALASNVSAGSGDCGHPTYDNGDFVDDARRELTVRQPVAVVSV
jgi:hypothetical protein